jgi:transposase-like protein
MSEKIVQFNEEIIKGQIKELVRGSVEETLNELLEKEAESLTQAARYERSEARQGYRSGHYDRNLTTTSGDVTLHMPRLKGVSFETAIIERYRRRESSVEEALIEMYLAGVSVRRVEDITEALWGSKVSPATISEDGIEETLTYCDFPSEHWTRIRTNNVIERLNREIRRRTRVVGTFPDGNSALMLVCARLRHVAGTQWGNKKYMNMKHLEAALDGASIAG